VVGQVIFLMKLGAADCFVVVVALLRTSHEVILTLYCLTIFLLLH
jgi:hypothetical protein